MPILRYSRKQPKDLTDADKIFILSNFFNANWDNMIRPYPRYYELLAKRGFYYPKDAMGQDNRLFYQRRDAGTYRYFFFLPG